MGTGAISERLLRYLEVTYRIADRELDRLPRNGPAVVVANHPFGILEGAVLATVLKQRRRDVRFLANGILTAILPELADLIIPVDPLGGHDSVSANQRGLRKSIEFLCAGGMLVIFPAGEVSHFQWRERAIMDPEWNTAVARMIGIVERRGCELSVVPIFVRGANSLLFQAAGLIHPRLRTALLARELLNKRRHVVDLRIGTPIDGGKLLAISTDQERTQYLRWRTYLLAKRNDFKPKISLPMLRRNRPACLETIAPAIPPPLLSAEIAALGSDFLLARSGDLEVYLAPSHRMPALLREIGRLREITFRAVGEGSGKASDLDRFDEYYRHLFAWNSVKCEIVGAYRLAATDVVLRSTGVEGLYTAKLFHFSDEFLDRLGPALEMGRSFIRAEYQKTLAPLALLWKGIARFIIINPRYKILFGPVSISNHYQSTSRELMISFLERRASLGNWVNLVRPRNAPKRTPTPVFCRDIEELSGVVADLEPAQLGVPVLLRQYLRLGGQLLGFNVDPDFSNSLDGLILVDLTKTEPKLLVRYLGKREATGFLDYHLSCTCCRNSSIGFASTAGFRKTVK